MINIVDFMKYHSLIFRYKSLLIIAGLAFGACNSPLTSGNNSQEEDLITIWVNHYMSTCTGMDIQWCLLYKEDKNDDWEYSYSYIKDFEYQWGYNYELEVEIVKEEDPQMDSPGGYFQLKKIKSKEKVDAGTSFELIVSEDGGPNYIINENGELDMLGVKVESQLSPEQMKPLFEGEGHFLIGVFQHSDQANQIQLLNLKTE